MKLYNCRECGAAFYWAYKRQYCELCKPVHYRRQRDRRCTYCGEKSFERFCSRKCERKFIRKPRCCLCLEKLKVPAKTEVRTIIDERVVLDMMGEVIRKIPAEKETFHYCAACWEDCKAIKRGDKVARRGQYQYRNDYTEEFTSFIRESRHSQPSMQTNEEYHLRVALPWSHPASMTAPPGPWCEPHERGKRVFLNIDMRYELDDEMD